MYYIIGDLGTAGTSGTSGINGSAGTSGTSGINGITGTSGLSGTSGVDLNSGISGTSGTSGLSSTSGTSGTSGLSSTSGTSGTTGYSGIVSKDFNIKIIEDTTVLKTGSGETITMICSELDNYNLTDCLIYVSTSGSCTVQVRNITKGVYMASVSLSGYVSTSSTLYTTLVNTGDLISVDVTSVGGSPKGLGIELKFTI